MARVPHHEESEIFHRLQVSGRLASNIVRVLLGLVEQILARPGCHGLKHLENSNVVANDVEVAIVNQNLEDIREYKNLYWLLPFI